MEAGSPHAVAAGIRTANPTGSDPAFAVAEPSLQGKGASTMKKVFLLITILAAVLATMVASLFAGEKAKCQASAEECLKNLNAKLATVGWLGIEYEKGVEGKTAIAKVISGSPAAAAGFQPGDILVAVNGVELGEANKEALAKVKKAMGPGSVVTYTVLRQGAKVELRATLVPLPDDVKKQKIEEHMAKEHGVKPHATK